LGAVHAWLCPTLWAMVPFTIELDDDAAEQLRRRAEREGVAPAKLAARLLAEVTGEPDPFDFVGSFESDTLGARDTDGFLHAHGFGAT
jgi:hypothetical protein